MSSYFDGKACFGDDSSQNVFVYQPTIDTLQLKEEIGTNYVLSCKSKEKCISKLEPIYSAFLHSIKLSEYKVGMNFDKDSVEQNNYATKIANAYIVYELDAWSKVPLDNFKLEELLV